MITHWTGLQRTSAQYGFNHRHTPHDPLEIKQNYPRSGHGFPMLAPCRVLHGESPWCYGLPVMSSSTNFPMPSNSAITKRPSEGNELKVRPEHLSLKEAGNVAIALLCNENCRRTAQAAAIESGNDQITQSNGQRVKERRTQLDDQQTDKRTMDTSRHQTTGKRTTDTI